MRTFAKGLSLRLTAGNCRNWSVARKRVIRPFYGVHAREIVGHSGIIGRARTLRLILHPLFRHVPEAAAFDQVKDLFR